MRILVHEFVSGGGLAGQAAGPSLAREGRAMLGALVTDLAAIPDHDIVTTADARFPLRVPEGVEVVTLPAPRDGGNSLLDSLIAAVDAVWLVAPETGGCLESLAARAERQGTRLLGPGAAAVRRASDKAGLAERLGREGVAYPRTRVLTPDAGREERENAAAELGYPVVVKPRRGAGCEGVCLVRHRNALTEAMEAVGQVAPGEDILFQEFVRGAAASVSLLTDGRKAVGLTANSQSIEAARAFAYRGGTTPLEHPLADRAIDAARQSCRALGGLRGYVGVDLILTDDGPVVIEVNPRLTTAYLGVRQALRQSVAALALDACRGGLPSAVAASRRVRFTATGRILSSSALG